MGAKSRQRQMLYENQDDPLVKAIQKQKAIPTANFKQELGLNPFGDEEPSEDESINLSGEDKDYDSLLLMNQKHHVQPGYGGRAWQESERGLPDKKKKKQEP